MDKHGVIDVKIAEIFDEWDDFEEKVRKLAGNGGVWDLRKNSLE